MGRVIRTLSELTSPQIQAIIDKAEIKATGVVTMPDLDLDAIQKRADELDPKSQIKADIYLLIHHLRKSIGDTKRDNC